MMSDKAWINYKFQIPKVPQASFLPNVSVVDGLQVRVSRAKVCYRLFTLNGLNIEYGVFEGIESLFRVLFGSGGERRGA